MHTKGLSKIACCTIEGADRIDHPDYTDIVLRESFINALLLRDYCIEGSILVSLFDDRLEFVSLGGVMPGVTRDLMLAGVSVARNDKLAQLFYRLKMIEAFGTGIPRIFSAYENAHAKPEIPIIDGGFLIRLPNMNYRNPQIGGNGSIAVSEAGRSRMGAGYKARGPAGEGRGGTGRKWLVFNSRCWSVRFQRTKAAELVPRWSFQQN